MDRDYSCNARKVNFTLCDNILGGNGRERQNEERQEWERNTEMEGGRELGAGGRERETEAEGKGGRGEKERREAPRETEKVASQQEKEREAGDGRPK